MATRSLPARILPHLYRFVERRFGGGDLASRRARLELLTKLSPKPADVRIESVTAGERPAELLVPHGARGDAVILYLHGGAYILGSVATHRGLAASIAKAAGVSVLIVDYRLAPEHPFPAAIDDAVAAYRWLRRQGFAPERTAIAGDSAGGGLTLATAVRLRDEGDFIPGALLLLSPWADLTQSGETITTKAAVDLTLPLAMLTEGAGAYLGQGDAAQPYASPVFADLRGLPPMLLQVGDQEILLSDATRIAAGARAAGVRATLDVWPGMWHVWHAFPVPEGRAAIQQAGTWLRGEIAP